MALAGNVTINVGVNDTQVIGAESVVSAIARAYNWAVASGTGPGLADKKWSSLARSLAASANEDIDLAGALVDAFGTVIFVKVKLILIAAAAANVNNVQVRRGATNGVPWITAVSAGMDLKPGGFLLWHDPVGTTVTAATGDLINIANSAAGTAVLYDIILIGTSA